MSDDIVIQLSAEIERLRAALYVAESDRDYYHSRLDEINKVVRDASA